MKTKRRFYKVFAILSPPSYKKKMSKMLIYAGENKIAVDDWLGSANLLSLLVFAAFLIYYPLVYRVFNYWHIGFGLTAVLIIQMMVYLLIYFKMEDRTARVEKVLPDAFQLMAANIRAGMTPYQAMKLSARDEFGPLKEEIEYATTKALGTESFSEVLGRMTERVNSEVLDRSMKLFSSSLKSGGHMAQILDDLAKDITETRTLKKEIVTNTKTYTMFILFTVLLGSPFLFAVSVQFLRVISSLHANTGVGAGTAAFGMGSFVGQIAVTPDFLTKIAIVMIVVTSILASALIGVIQEGKEKQGLRYAPLIAIAGVAIFYGATILIGNFFANML